MPSLRSAASFSRQRPRSHENRPKASSGRSVCGTSGGGSVGKGCVGDATSPGTSEAGTGRSSTGKTGSPVSRCSTNRWPGLRGLHHDGDLAPVAHERGEHRLRGHVVVPEVVVHGLELPDQLARARAQRHHRVRVAVVAEPHAAVVVGARRAGRHEHEVARGVVGEDRPGVRRAGERCALARPLRVRGIVAAARDRIPDPDAARPCARRSRARCPSPRSRGCCRRSRSRRSRDRRPRSAATRWCSPRAGPRRCLPSARPRRRGRSPRRACRSRRRARRGATRRWPRRCAGGSGAPAGAAASSHCATPREVYSEYS